MPDKILLYNGPNTGPNSRSDLKEFLLTQSIFDHPEILETDFKNNFDGLTIKDNPTIAIPGGAAFYMGHDLRFQAPLLKELVYNGFNYMGICAGTFLASDQSNIFKTSYEISDSIYSDQLAPVEHVLTCTNTIGLCNEYSVFSSFYPDNSYLSRNDFANIKNKHYKPYVADIHFHHANKIVPELFNEGCGFEVASDGNHSATKQFEVVATYATRHRATLFYPKICQFKQLENIPAIIRKKANEQTGGIFLSGLHIETLKESNLLKMCSGKQSGNDKAAPLNEQDQQKILESREESLQVVVPLVKETFRR